MIANVPKIIGQITTASFALPARIAALNLLPAGRAAAQTFTTLHSFTSGSGSGPTNGDGAFPQGGLVLSGNMLYGTAARGGGSAGGTVFAVTTDGTNFTVLHDFQKTLGLRTPCASNADCWRCGGQCYNGAPCPRYCANPNTGNPCYSPVDWHLGGAYPYGGLVLSGNYLYGTASSFGSSSSYCGVVASYDGTVFSINADGTGFRTLHNFAGSDRAYPYAGLISSGGRLYGTTQQGGNSGNGTVFGLSFTPHVTIVRSGTNVILKWPTNVAGFDYTGYTLQSTTNLGSPAVWSTNSHAPVVIAGQNNVTNPITGPQQFYRLVQ